MPNETITLRALNRATLARQMLLTREKVPALKAIERLAGLQAQVARPPFVGLWTRLEGFQREELLKLLHQRKVVRATLMRCTLHLMSAKDYLALRSALQPVLNAAMRSALGERTKGVDLDALTTAARQFFAEPRTFTALREALAKEFPQTDERALGYTVRTKVPLVMVPDGTPWGFPANADFTVADSWLGETPAAGEKPHALIQRYLAAFGPATAADVQTWSGLKGVAPVLEELRPKLRVLRDERGRELFDLPKAPRPPEDTPAPVRFLPDFDNLVLAHADRTRIIAEEHRPRIVTKNLLVLATFLVDGMVAGTWKVVVEKKTATLVISPFGTLPATARKELLAEGEALVHFMEPEAAQHAVRVEKG
jgi:hypothetical protein